MIIIMFVKHILHIYTFYLFLSVHLFSPQHLAYHLGSITTPVAAMSVLEIIRINDVKEVNAGVQPHKKCIQLVQHRIYPSVKQICHLH